MITVHDFINLCTDDNIADCAVWDGKSGRVVFKGSMGDAKFEYGDYEVCSFDPPVDGEPLCINIELE